jgi:hypothetical protein
MAQGQNRFVCECGKQFNNREGLEQHRMECPAAQAQQQNEGSGRTRAMGSTGRVEDIEE